QEKIGDDGAMTERPEVGIADNARLIVGIVVTFAGVRASMKLGSWLFDVQIMDSVSIFGIGIAVYMLFHTIANRKSIEKPGRIAFSPVGFIVAIVITILLCGLASVIPALR